ncbi:hypothetical protein B4166_1290 [Caldibacillus thermoamylovorans]|nr:hypothetical protein B4166_1290 [Caldibacillus thermoamylovorans]
MNKFILEPHCFTLGVIRRREKWGIQILCKDYLKSLTLPDIPMT